MQFECDKVLSTLEKDFLEILTKVLTSSNNQRYQPNPNKNRSTPNANRKHYNTGINNRARTLTTLSPSATHANRTHSFQHMFHRMSENNMYGGNGCLTNHTHHELKIEDIPITQDHLDNHIEIVINEAFTIVSLRASNWFHSYYPHEYSNIVFHASNTTASNLETPPHSRGTVYKGTLLSPTMVEQTIIQAALASIEMFDGTKAKFEAWTKSIKNAVQIAGQNAICMAFSKLTGSPL